MNIKFIPNPNAKHGIKGLTRGFNMGGIIIGSDSETRKDGTPQTFQFFSKTPGLTCMIWTTAEKSTKDFINYLRALPTTGRPYYMFGHNLAFDGVEFLYSNWSELVDDEVDFKFEDVRIKGISSNLTFLNFSFPNGKKVILIDTFAFFPTSLAKLEKMCELNLPKLKTPKGLGEKEFGPDDEEFCAYAMRDAEIAAGVGELICRLHEESNIPICVSRAQMASKIFKRKYMRDLRIPPQSATFKEAGWEAYHGGKNGLYVESGLYKNVYGLDIISAYPHAMSTFPSFCEAGLYRQISGEGDPGTLPNHGIYRVWGETKTCKFPIIFKRLRGKPMHPVFGVVDGVWTTGFELNEAVSSGELKISKLEGFYYQSELDHNYSPLANFSLDFFELKNSATNPLYREFYKVILNSISGKLIESRKVATDCEIGVDLNGNKVIDQEVRVTGQMFNSFIAALITGHTRAEIHRMEHKYNSIHTSTDGIFTLNKPEEFLGLGGQKIDFFGDLLIIRNKVYIGYVGKNENGDLMESILFPGKYIKKYATHAFLGDIRLLEWMVKTGVQEYDWVHVNKLKESLKRGLNPNEFVKKHSSLKNVNLANLVPGISGVSSGNWEDYESYYIKKYGKNSWQLKGKEYIMDSNTEGGEI